MSAIGSVPVTTDPAANLIASFQPILDRLGTIQRGCFCEQTVRAFGDASRKCMNCLVENARARVAEYEASKYHGPLTAYVPEIPECSTCGLVTTDNTVQYAFDGTRTAQCRACYVAMREREMAGAL